MMLSRIAAACWFVVAFALGACGDHAPVRGVERTEDLGAADASGGQQGAVAALPASAGAATREAETAVAVSAALPRADSLDHTLTTVRIRALAEDVGEDLELLLLSLDTKGLPAALAKRGLMARWSWNSARRFGKELSVTPSWSEDENGPTADAEVLLPAKHATVFARLGGKVTSRRLPLPSSRTELVLNLRSPSAALRTVTVLGADGRRLPGVQVLSLRAANGSRKSASASKMASAVETNDQGDVELASKDNERAGAVLLGSTIVLSDPILTDRIHMPDVGTVRLTLESSDASPEGHGIVDAEIKLSAAEFVSNAGRSIDELRSDDGKLELFPMATRKWYLAEATTDDAFGSLRFKGPSEDHEVLDVTLQLTKSRIARLKLVDESGAPLVGMSCTVRLESLDAKRMDAITDGTGALTCVCHGRIPSDPLGRLYVQESVDSKDPNDGLFGVVKVPETMTHAKDFGTVMMRPVATLFEGHVVDEDGQEMKSCTVKLLRKQEGLTRSGAATFETLATAKSDKAGAFRIRARGMNLSDSNRPLFIVANTKKGRYTTGLRSIESGDARLVLTVLRPGSVSIDATPFNAPVMIRPLDLILQHDEYHAYNREVPLGAHKLVEGLAPGTYTLYFVVSEEAHFPLERNIVILPGQEAAAVHLVGEEFEALTPWTSIEVSMPDGKPARLLTVNRVLADGQVSRDRYRGVGGYFEVTVDPQATPLCYWIEVPGCLRHKLPTLKAGAKIQLEPEVQLEVQLVGAPLPQGALVLRAEPKDAAFPSAASVALEFDASGRATATFNGTGTYVIKDASGTSRTVNGAAPWMNASFEVPALGGSAEIQVRQE